MSASKTDPARAPWWCASCGHLASYVGASIDPRHPIVVCLKEPRSCGRTVGCASAEEARQVVAARRLLGAVCGRTYATPDGRRRHMEDRDHYAPRVRA